MDKPHPDEIKILVVLYVANAINFQKEISINVAYTDDMLNHILHLIKLKFIDQFIDNFYPKLSASITFEGIHYIENITTNELIEVMFSSQNDYSKLIVPISTIFDMFKRCYIRNRLTKSHISYILTYEYTTKTDLYYLGRFAKFLREHSNDY